MFETSVVRAQAQAATGRLSLLSMSIIAHTSIVIGAVAISIATVKFPAMAPNEYSRAPIFETVQIPPPLGNPNGGATSKPKTETPVQKPPVDNKQITAPAATPEEVKPADTPTTGGDSNENNDSTGKVEGPVGVPWGDPKSILTTLDAPPVVDAPVQQPEEKVYQAHEVVAPVLLNKVEPRYPPHLVKAAVPATVIVRCVIDKNGNVRDAEVVVPASMAPFNNEVLRVISQWRYKAATYAGRPVDSYLTLTVHFSVKR